LQFISLYFNKGMKIVIDTYRLKFLKVGVSQMSNTVTLKLSEIKSELKAVILYNSDRGFLPYNGCNRACDAMITIVEKSKALGDRKLTFDIHLFILVEVVKLISYADTSSGAAGDVIRYCLAGLEELSKSSQDDNRKQMLDAIIKTSKNKVFKDWAEYGYQLLRNTVYLVQDQKQAEKVYDMFPILGSMYGGKEYPDRYVITLGIIERLGGAAVANQYLMDHLDVSEIRVIAVERALSAKKYSLAEELCVEALQKDKPYGKPTVWAYYLERNYAELTNREKQIEMVRLILMRGDKSYYVKLKELYQSEGTWEQIRETVLQELSKAYISHEYAALLSKEGELSRLLGVVQVNNMYIEYYGEQLANEFPAETYPIYDKHILREAAAATDRRKYKGVCKLIKCYSDAGAKEEARCMIRRLVEMYPRRMALVDELEALGRKLMK
jgi:hypothetical protein